MSGSQINLVEWFNRSNWLSLRQVSRGFYYFLVQQVSYHWENSKLRLDTCTQCLSIMFDKWYGIQSSIFVICLPNDLRQTERININQETHQWNNRGICKLCQGIRKLSFHNLGYFGVVKAWKVLPAIKHKVVRPPAAALILSLLFLAWLLFALCHLFPVSSFVRPPPSPFYPPPPPSPDQAWLEASRRTNMHKQTPICQYPHSTGVCPVFAF